MPRASVFFSRYGFSLSSQLSLRCSRRWLLVLTAHNASTIKVIPEMEPLRIQTRILEMDLVVVEDVPAGYHYNFEVADEGVVGHSKLPSQDSLEGCDCRMREEIVSQPLHCEVVVAKRWHQVDDILRDWDVDVVASSVCAIYQSTLRRWSYWHLSSFCIYPPLSCT